MNWFKTNRQLRKEVLSLKKRVEQLERDLLWGRKCRNVELLSGTALDAMKFTEIEQMKDKLKEGV